MEETNNSLTIGESLMNLIRRMLESDKTALAEGVTLYTSFGIVRGRISRISAKAGNRTIMSSESFHLHSSEVLEIEDVAVEHYANHLPSAHYDRLFIHTGDIKSFAIVHFSPSGY